MSTKRRKRKRYEAEFFAHAIGKASPGLVFESSRLTRDPTTGDVVDRPLNLVYDLTEVMINGDYLNDNDTNFLGRGLIDVLNRKYGNAIEITATPLIEMPPMPCDVPDGPAERLMGFVREHDVGKIYCRTFEVNAPKLLAKFCKLDCTAKIAVLAPTESVARFIHREIRIEVDDVAHLDGFDTDDCEKRVVVGTAMSMSSHWTRFNAQKHRFFLSRSHRHASIRNQRDDEFWRENVRIV